MVASRQHIFFTGHRRNKEEKRWDTGDERRKTAVPKRTPMHSLRHLGITAIIILILMAAVAPLRVFAGPPVRSSESAGSATFNAEPREGRSASSLPFRLLRKFPASPLCVQTCTRGQAESIRTVSPSGTGGGRLQQGITDDAARIHRNQRRR